MGTYADRMNSLDLRFTSPDGQVTARLTQNTRVEIAFSRGSYERYTEGSLEVQLTALARLVFAGRRKAHWEALSAAIMETAGRPAEPEKEHNLSAKQKKFRERHRELETRGKSKQDLVRIANTGMQNWTVRVKPGALSQLGENEFKSELATAVAAMMDHYRYQVALLKESIYSTQVRNAAPPRAQ